MLHGGKDDFLSSMANTLSGNRVETACVEKALALICGHSSFCSGAIYEIDLSGGLILMEHFVSDAVTLPAQLEAQVFLQDDSCALTQGAAAYMAKGQQSDAFELRLMDLFSAQSIALAPMLDKDGSLYGLVLLFETASPSVIDEASKSTMAVAFFMLIRYIQQRMYQRKLHQAQTTMGSILDNTGIDIYVNDFSTHEILYVNKSMAAPYGGQEQFMGKKCWETLFAGQTEPCAFCPQNKLLDEQGQPSKVYTWDYQRPFDGSWFRVFSAAFRWVDGRLAHVVSSADITDNKRNEALVENLANYDQLTKLPNRRMLVRECERRFDNATEPARGYLLFFDIDGFKEINDNFGHDSGDEFLVQLGAFFSSIPLLKDAIYRNGGDEFVALIDGGTVTKSNIRSLANLIQARFKKPWILKKGETICSTSIGVACYPEDGVTAEVLLQKADMAMYQIKKSGGGGLYFACQLKTPPTAT